jgi:TRAP-type mannitol/chloroaromatic compound transport system permease large subunit
MPAAEVAVNMTRWNALSPDLKVLVEIAVRDFARDMVLMGGIGFMQSLVKGLALPPFGMLIVIMVIWVILGTALEWIAIMLLTLPIFMPIIKSLGYDPVWFGILFNINMQIAYLSPPFGGACFFLKGVAPPDVTMEEIFASCWPWMGLQLVGLALVMAFPELALWLPRVAR